MSPTIELCSRAVSLVLRVYRLPHSCAPVPTLTNSVSTSSSLPCSTTRPVNTASRMVKKIILATRQGEQQPVLLALVIALLVVMGYVLLQGSAQRSLPEQDEFRQAFLFHRSHPAFRIGVQIRTPGW